MNNNFTIVKKGYDPDQVDKHIYKLEAELREYREKDASIAGAILNAQIAADEILRKANVAADTIMQNSRGLSKRLNEKSASHVAGLIEGVKEHRSRLQRLKDYYGTLLRKYFVEQDVNDIALAETKAVELESYLQKFLDAELSPDVAAALPDTDNGIITQTPQDTAVPNGTARNPVSEEPADTTAEERRFL